MAPPPDDPDDAVAVAPALSVLVAAELSVLVAAELSVLVAAELSVDEEPESVEEPLLPAALSPLLAIARVHDLVSRTRGSPLFPVIGSSVIVHVWIIGPTALRGN